MQQSPSPSISRGYTDSKHSCYESIIPTTKVSVKEILQEVQYKPGS